MKTNAARLLDRLGVTYDLREYEVDPEDLAAEVVARKVGLPPERVFKALVMRGTQLLVVPADYARAAAARTAAVSRAKA